MIYGGERRQFLDTGVLILPYLEALEELERLKICWGSKDGSQIDAAKHVHQDSRTGNARQWRAESYAAVKSSSL